MVLINEKALFKSLQKITSLIFEQFIQKMTGLITITLGSIPTKFIQTSLNTETPLQFGY